MLADADATDFTAFNCIITMEVKHYTDGEYLANTSKLLQVQAEL